MFIEGEKFRKILGLEKLAHSIGRNIATMIEAIFLQVLKPSVDFLSVRVFSMNIFCFDI